MKYQIENIGCDDLTSFEMELTDKELELVVRLFEENNKVATCGCTPHLFVYDNNDEPLNKDYPELEYERKHREENK